ncbi:unnamed protein product [Cyberlindnera jadinii]|uniref:SH3 domain-containing protein n=1 Tax=Cyberlindnera jadinii (strain ATCC 18201 / CBS 1600 / BCRC 20928 / JCM 3617 / NBRC 0987 / NRRL Y-1542) TaxID=983966 RepID=A0A0H5C7I6_CYBJN|nr:unnamed protein product [Cyberlindnera jadinii]
MSAEALHALLTTRADLLKDDTLTEKKRVPSTGSSVSGSEGSVVITRENGKPQDQMLKIRTKNLSLDYNEEDDFNDYVIEDPLPPPKELHPDKLYALYAFKGDDPSHCELERDDAVVLLNDQDSYWWLVRKEKDSSIGFAPAECLETYDERLARLNCWKNEEMERSSKETLQIFMDRSMDRSRNKSVTFSEEVTVTEREPYPEEEEELSDASIDELISVKDDGHFGILPTDLERDEAFIETNSDALGSDFVVPPLVLKKNQNKKLSDGFDPEIESPLSQPQAFFINSNGSGSIGTYSPSSSEMESPGDTPNMNKYARKSVPDSPEDYERRGNIPQSRRTRDIAKSMQMLDDLINEEMETTRASGSSTEEEEDVTITTDYNHNRLSPPIELKNTKTKNLSMLTNSTNSNSNVSLGCTRSDSTASSSLEVLQVPKLHEQVPETIPINPQVEEMFRLPFGKMDELSQKLKALHMELS